jgi:hypothetical protein
VFTHHIYLADSFETEMDDLAVCLSMPTLCPFPALTPRSISRKLSYGMRMVVQMSRIWRAGPARQATKFAKRYRRS